MGTKRGAKQNSSGTQYNPKGVTQGVTLVCPETGNPIGCVVDSNGIERLAVDANFTAQNVQVNADLDFLEDGVHIGDPNSGNILLINPDGSIDVNCEIDAADGDNISISAHPIADQIFDEAADTITTAAFEEIYSYTSTNSNTRILAVECTVSTPAIIRLKINGVIVRTRRTSSLEKNTVFEFKEHRPLLTTSILSVEAQVERKIKTIYDTFVSLEGYLA